MLANLTKKEIDYICALHDPVCLKETLYPANIKACHTWIEEDYVPYHVRNYQFAWQPYNLLICDDTSLVKEKNFKKKQLAGTCYNIGARDIGKSYDFIQADFPLNIVTNPGKESCLISASSGFLQKVANPIINIFREHPFFKMFHKKRGGINAGENMEIQARNGHTWYGRNEKVNDPEPGTKIHGLHFEVKGYEEYSYATKKGQEKMIDSGTSLGEIERPSGIPDVRIGSPLGDVFHNKENKRFICRLPQYVRSDWSEEQRTKRAESYKGETSLGFKLNVIGEVTEGAEGFWDLEKLKDACLVKSHRIKNIDIDEKKANNFEKYLIIDRLPCEQVFVCADIGAGARPTEIAIIFFNGKKYKPVYNITVNVKSSQTQAHIFAEIYKKLGGAFVGIDATTDYGIAERLKKDYPFINPTHIYPIDLRKKIPVGIEKDPKTQQVIRDRQGNIILKEMIAIDFAMQELEDLFYNAKMEIGIDNKLFKEFGDFLVVQNGLRRSYDTCSNDDYHQAYQIFAILRHQFEFESLLDNNNRADDGCLGVF